MFTKVGHVFYKHINIAQMNVMFFGVLTVFFSFVYSFKLIFFISLVSGSHNSEGSTMDRCLVAWVPCIRSIRSPV